MAKDLGGVEGGTKLSDYKDNALDLTAEYRQVRMWRERIARQRAILQIDERITSAKRGDEYLEGKAVAPNTKKLYLRYLPPLLEELHRKTLPAIPMARMEAKTERGELWADKARELIGISFNDPTGELRGTLDDMQWEDARWGEAFGRVKWNSTYEPAELNILKDPEQIALEVESAQLENAEPERANVANEDIDYIHARIHLELLNTLAPEDPIYEPLRDHLDQHEARMQIVKREGPILERIPVDRFVYDTDVPWPERAWEAEEKSLKIADMATRGWRNLNEQNLPRETKPGESKEVAFEDMTAKVYDIHDRRNGRWYVISVNGPLDGLFLYKGTWPYGKIDNVKPMVMRHHDPRKVRGIATIAAATPILDELAEVDFFISRHVANHCDYKLGGPKSTNSPDIKAGLNDPNRRFVFEGSPEQWALMKEIQPPPIPQTLLGQWDRLWSTLRLTVGVDVQEVGGSHPHQISATESFERSESTEERKDDRQGIVGRYLAWVAKTYLALYHKFGTISVMVRVLGPAGAVYDQIDPTDLPEDIEVFLDVRGETEQGKIQELEGAKLFNDFLMTGVYPADMQKWGEYFGRRCGIPHPENFRLQLPQGQVMGETMPGSPGMQQQPAEKNISFPAVTPPAGPGQGPQVQAAGA